MPVPVVAVPPMALAVVPSGMIAVLTERTLVPRVRVMALDESTVLRRCLAIEPAALELRDLADERLESLLLPVRTHRTQTLRDLRHEPRESTVALQSVPTRVGW